MAVKILIVKSLISYVTYTPTANCDMQFNSSMNTSAQNEIALCLNIV